MPLPPGKVYGCCFLKTWPTRLQGMISRLPPHCQTRNEISEKHNSSQRLTRLNIQHWKTCATSKQKQHQKSTTLWNILVFANFSDTYAKHVFPGCRIISRVLVNFSTSSTAEKSAVFVEWFGISESIMPQTLCQNLKNSTSLSLTLQFLFKSRC